MKGPDPRAKTADEYASRVGRGAAWRPIKIIKSSDVRHYCATPVVAAGHARARPSSGPTHAHRASHYAAVISVSLTYARPACSDTCTT